MWWWGKVPRILAEYRSGMKTEIANKSSKKTWRPHSIVFVGVESEFHEFKHWLGVISTTSPLGEWIVFKSYVLYEKSVSTFGLRSLDGFAEGNDDDESLRLPSTDLVQCVVATRKGLIAGAHPEKMPRAISVQQHRVAMPSPQTRSSLALKYGANGNRASVAIEASNPRLSSIHAMIFFWRFSVEFQNIMAGMMTQIKSEMDVIAVSM
jgi:hypothetical protein